MFGDFIGKFFLFLNPCNECTLRESLALDCEQAFGEVDSRHSG